IWALAHTPARGARNTAGRMAGPTAASIRSHNARPRVQATAGFAFKITNRSGAIGAIKLVHESFPQRAAHAWRFAHYWRRADYRMRFAFRSARAERQSDPDRHESRADRRRGITVPGDQHRA